MVAPRPGDLKGGSMDSHHMSQVHIAEGPRGYAGALWCVCSKRFETRADSWGTVWCALVEAHAAHRDERAEADNAVALAHVSELHTTHPPP